MTRLEMLNNKILVELKKASEIDKNPLNAEGLVNIQKVFKYSDSAVGSDRNGEKLVKLEKKGKTIKC